MRIGIPSARVAVMVLSTLETGAGVDKVVGSVAGVGAGAITGTGRVTGLGGMITGAPGFEGAGVTLAGTGAGAAFGSRIVSMTTAGTPALLSRMISVGERLKFVFEARI